MDTTDDIWHQVLIKCGQSLYYVEFTRVNSFAVCCCIAFSRDALYRTEETAKSRELTEEELAKVSVSCMSRDCSWSLSW